MAIDHVTHHPEVEHFAEKIHFVNYEEIGLLGNADFTENKSVSLSFFCGEALILLSRDCRALLLVVQEMEECPSLLFDRLSFEAGTFAN